MTKIDPTSTLGELVAAVPARVALFERLGFDYCCGGGLTLAQASAQSGLDADTVLVMLDALGDAAPAATGEREWGEASLAELCDHIVAVHHDGMRRDLPRMDELLAKVVRVHGPADPRIGELRAVFDGLRAEVEPHLETEERTLFPAVRALEQDGTPVAEDLLESHEDEHRRVGAALAAMRELGGGYDPAGARCGTHRALLDALLALELDLHQHIHEENNVLFTRVRQLNAAAEGVGAGA